MDSSASGQSWSTGITLTGPAERCWDCPEATWLRWAWCIVRGNFCMYQYYRKDRLKNSVFLSLSVCTNGLSYSGEETQPNLCLKGCQANSGISFLEQINSSYTEYKAFGPSLIYNNIDTRVGINKTSYTNSQDFLYLVTGKLFSIF